MNQHRLHMRVSHPIYGIGTVEQIKDGFIKVRFDKDNIVQYIPEKRESFVAEQQRRVEEKW